MIPNLPTSKAVLTPMAAAAFATLYFLLDLFSILLCVRATWLGLRIVSLCRCGLSIGTWLCPLVSVALALVSGFVCVIEQLLHIARCPCWLAEWSGLDLVAQTEETRTQILLEKAAYCNITQ